MRGILHPSAAPPRAGRTRVARVHRTTTTATLLVTVAVSALSGCVTVQRPPVPGSPAGPSRTSAPEPEGQTQTQIVQAPAREALELIETSRRPEPAASPSRLTTPAATAPQQRRQPPGTRDVRPRPARPERPEPAPRGPRLPHTGLPDVPDSVRQDVRENVPKNTDVCALGRRYGGWRADSPEATICRDTYGR
ncbi:hypothetical protein SCNRRL3882_6763 [Streptomyces chartreusis NRRL 3882]|uniref:Uncharacterized protein n=1 Tax=Streptomyces chartreusis NRRL 3882 TaxID=1079985 RepID=A0A2N9BIW4_STRCX|nr:hypothetical protein SCNRRL3882_6763 [Streptomyces chartreusis NRRL 3882]